MATILNYKNSYLKYLTYGSKRGMAVLLFNVGEIWIEYDVRHAEIRGSIKYGS